MWKWITRRLAPGPEDYALTVGIAPSCKRFTRENMPQRETIADRQRTEPSRPLLDRRHG